MKDNRLFALLITLACVMVPGRTVCQTVLYPAAEAAVRDGSNFNTDINEASLGYLMVKYSTAGSSGKAYFKFDLTGQNPNTNDALTLTFTTYNNSQRQHAQVWALDQPYPAFTGASLVWATAQANETNSNSLLTNAAVSGFTATPLIDFLSPNSAGATASVTIPPPWARFIVDNQLVLVLVSPFNDPVNLANGFRIKTNTAFLSFPSLVGSPPTITPLTNVTITAGEWSGPQSFTIADAEDAPNLLSLTATSSNENVVPSGNVEFTGTEAQRSLRVLAGNTAGTATISVKVTDAAGNSAVTLFQVLVLPLNYAPSMTTPLPVFTQTNSPVTVPFTVADLETPAADLTVSGEVASYSTTILGNLAFNGTGSNRSVTVMPAPDADGVGVVNLAVTDGGGAVTNVSFPVMVLPGQQVVFREHFDYPDGKLFANSASLWRRRNSQAQSVNLNTASQQAFIRPKNSADDGAAPLAGGPYTPGHGVVLYTTTTATWMELPDVLPAVTNSVGSFLQLLNDSSATSAALAEVGTTTNAVPEGFFQVGLLDYSGALQPYTGLNLALPAGGASTTHKLITRYDVDTGASALWVDASSESAPSVSSTDILDPVAISYVGLRQDLGMGYIYIDDLTITLTLKPIIISVSSTAEARMDLVFDGGPGDSPSSFTVEFSQDLNQPFARAEATITPLTGTRFQANTAAPGYRGFYRLKRVPIDFQ